MVAEISEVGRGVAGTSARGVMGARSEGWSIVTVAPCGGGMPEVNRSTDAGSGIVCRVAAPVGIAPRFKNRGSGTRFRYVFVLEVDEVRST